MDRRKTYKIIMSKIKSLIHEKSKTPKGRILIASISIVFLWLTHKIYIWANSESTDNAYLDGYVTFVSPQVNGVIKELHFSENQKVTKDQLLIKINDQDYKASFEQATNAVEGGKIAIELADSQISIAKIEMDRAQDTILLTDVKLQNNRKEFQRVTRLTRDDFSTKKLLDDATLNLKIAETENNSAKLSFQSAKQKLIELEQQKQSEIIKLKGLENALQLAKNNYDYTSILSPIDGVITSSAARTGGYVRAGVQIFAVVPVEGHYIRANFKETQIKKFKPGMKAKITFDVIGNEIFDAEIISLYPATGSKFSLLPTDNATGNFTKIVQRVPVYLSIDIPEKYKEKLTLGSSVNVSIRTNQ